MYCLEIYRRWEGRDRNMNETVTERREMEVSGEEGDGEGERSNEDDNNGREPQTETAPSHHSPQSHIPLLHLLRRLYVGHFFGRWGARMWDFSVGLYMIHVWPNSLLFAAVYGAIESASTVFFGPIVGRWVDRSTYLKVLRLWCLTQFLSFTVAGGTVLKLLFYPKLKLTNLAAFISFVVLINLSGAIVVLSNLAGYMLIEKQWVVVISEGLPEEVQTRLNSVFRRIDLGCKLFAPVLTGFVISFVSLKSSAMALAVWNTVSVWSQYWLLTSVYRGIPALSESSHNRISKDAQNDPEEGRPVPQPVETPSHSNAELEDKSCRGRIIKKFLNIPFVVAWRVYLQQDIVLPGIALALTNFNVLSFGTLMIATLQWEGIPTYIIGIGRGLSASVGICATVVYPRLHSRVATLRTGLWSVWSMWAFLWICVGSVFVKNRAGSAYMLIGGVATSRLGLWMFDLAVTQLMQENVPDACRCAVGGVQSSLQSFLELMPYIVGILLSVPKDFWKLGLLSFCIVTVAAVLYNVHVYRIRKHIFHFEKLSLLVKRCIK